MIHESSGQKFFALGAWVLLSVVCFFAMRPIPQNWLSPPFGNSERLDLGAYSLAWTSVAVQSMLGPTEDFGSQVTRPVNDLFANPLQEQRFRVNDQPHCQALLYAHFIPLQSGLRAYRILLPLAEIEKRAASVDCVSVPLALNPRRQNLWR